MKLKQFYHHCFEATDIRDGDHIPVGGGAIWSPLAPWQVTADFQNFYSRFDETTQCARQKYDTPAWHEWFRQAAPGLDPKIAVALQVFTVAFEPKRQRQEECAAERKALYGNAPDGRMLLSEMFQRNNALCVETATLAKRYLDRNGVTSRLFSGEVMPHYMPGEINGAEAHTFLIIDDNGTDYIYDPTKRPRNIPGAGMFFSLYQPSVSFRALDDRLQRDSLMVAAVSVMRPYTQIYYGVGDGGNVPEDLIIHHGTCAPGA